MLISEYHGKSTNLQFMKFIASILVIFSHSYTVAGEGKADFLSRLSGDQISFGGFAVAIFFFASGFFVTGSLKRSKTGLAYWKKRLFRIYPSFTVVVLATTFVLGPLVTTLPLRQYFLSSETYRYLEYLLLIPRYRLPGVFENNPIASNVNGSLWTLILEMICYMALFLVFCLKILEKEREKRVLAAVLFASAFYIFALKPAFLFQFHGYLRPAFIFAEGMLYCLFADRIKLNGLYGALCMVGIVVLYYVHLADLAMVLLLPYVLAVIFFSRHQLPETLGKPGNYSYGIYLCAFPIQQVLKYLDPGMNFLQNTGLASAISMFVSVLLLHFVEKPMEKLCLQRGSKAARL